MVFAIGLRCKHIKESSWVSTRELSCVSTQNVSSRSWVTPNLLRLESDFQAGMIAKIGRATFIHPLSWNVWMNMIVIAALSILMVIPIERHKRKREREALLHAAKARKW
jgi:hypothetical protein